MNARALLLVAGLAWLAWRGGVFDRGGDGGNGDGGGGGDGGNGDGGGGGDWRNDDEWPVHEV